MRRFGAWGILLLGLLALAHQVGGAIPRESRLMLHLPRDRSVREVRIEVSGLDGQLWRNIELHPPIPNPLRQECSLRVPRGTYRIDVTYEVRSAGVIDKNHESDWTRVGVRHQILLDGEDQHFPPPEDEAK